MDVALSIYDSLLEGLYRLDRAQLGRLADVLGVTLHELRAVLGLGSSKVLLSLTPAEDAFRSLINLAQSRNLWARRDRAWRGWLGIRLQGAGGPSQAILLQAHPLEADSQRSPATGPHAGNPLRTTAGAWPAGLGAEPKSASIRRYDDI